MRVIELHDWNERPGLTGEWARLWSEQPGAPVFVHPIWARTWWRYFGRGRRLRLLLVEDAGRAVALAPLFLERPLPAPGRLRIIGAGVTNDFHDWLLPADHDARVDCLKTLFDYLAGRWGWLTLELQGLRTDSRLLPQISQAHGPGLLIRPRPGPASPAVQIHGSWASYLSARPASLRRNIRNRQRRLAELGDVRYEHADAASAEAAVDEVIHLHDLRWSGRADVTLVSRSARGRAFYRAVLPRLVAERIADVVSLRLNGRAIATQVGFVVGGSYYNYQVAFDPSLARYAPSTLLLVHLLERAWDDGLKTFDFMTGDEPYKLQWADQSPSICHVTILPNQPIARALGRAMDLGRKFRTVRDKANRKDDAETTSEDRD
jgi:CelD/BcsL family acetyltransferase involved in cellulose biosynthesis